MEHYQIKTVESRVFDIVGATSLIEVEFHKDPSWAGELEGIRIVEPQIEVDGLALARYTSRTALTGSALPPMTIQQDHLEPIPLDSTDLLELSFLIASFGRMPEEDYSVNSRYIKLRNQIAALLGIPQSHLRLRLRARKKTEDAIETVAMRLAEHSIAFSNSPELGFVQFVELIKHGGRIFSFSAGADALLGTSALASAYQLGILSNPVIAVQLAAGGATAYVVLKFGAAVGKRVEQFIQNWKAG